MVNGRRKDVRDASMGTFLASGKKIAKGWARRSREIPREKADPSPLTHNIVFNERGSR
jgi:hypothetical protein